MEGLDPDREVLSAGEVAEYLGVGPVTVYRWCRDGRLPCVKIGKVWRIRRAALQDFLLRNERRETLADELRCFLRATDHTLVIAETVELLRRLDAAFFRVGEARGASLVKFHRGDAVPLGELRDGLARHGLDVERLEDSGQLRFIEETEPVHGRPEQLRRLRAEESDEGRTIWASFDWVEQATLEELLRQQEQLSELVDSQHLVIETGMLERVMDEWPLAVQRRARQVHRGAIWVSESGLLMIRTTPLPRR